jgi:signal transduction histidine kinase
MDEGAGIFALGSTTKPNRLGMGLAIAERALATLRGSIQLRSEPDGATRFEITCPRVTI